MSLANGSPVVGEVTRLSLTASRRYVIENEKVPKDMLELAMHIVDTKRGKFEPLKFEDEYEDALKDLLKKKQKGEKIERAKEPARSNVINLMDALRQSVKSERGSGERRKPEKARARPQKKVGPTRVTGRQAERADV
jgi:DNA end-binding protein Ku